MVSRRTKRLLSMGRILTEHDRLADADEDARGHEEPSDAGRRKAAREDTERHEWDFVKQSGQPGVAARNTASQETRPAWPPPKAMRRTPYRRTSTVDTRPRNAIRLMAKAPIKASVGGGPTLSLARCAWMIPAVRGSERDSVSACGDRLERRTPSVICARTSRR
jgi:hypothetical protein